MNEKKHLTAYQFKPRLFVEAIANDEVNKLFIENDVGFFIALIYESKDTHRHLSTPRMR